MPLTPLSGRIRQKLEVTAECFCSRSIRIRIGTEHCRAREGELEEQEAEREDVG